ncbi:hypothetical protein N3K66_004071 [Trichothecium roseum]|uniref:Uncharacterized protein n=1 Tax=Trichothecium roseum TaxID=47278 RepID=A0ACC0V958_9HYPO|nr:hypothetical protein N3K66_004071 [Trichothecium roseum]
MLPSPLSRIPTPALLRSYVLTTLMTHKPIMSPALSAIGLIARSKSRLLNPDRNPLLNQILRRTVFDHFCPGTTEAQVRKTIARLKGMGFHGVILGFSKEIVLDPDEAAREERSVVVGYGAAEVGVVERWRDENLRTLSMVAPGDFIAVKLTGAGPMATEALQSQSPIPRPLSQALDRICAQAVRQNSRLWIDAEQQAFQPGIDAWTVDLMRRHNRDPRRGPLVYNTIQAYLKGARANADRHVEMAAREGWALGVKLVRGAYIAHEVRGLIHDTKEETDRSYDDIARRFISRTLPPGCGEGIGFPRMALMLASHNADSARGAIALQAERMEAGLPTIALECAQILGMADELSCELLQDYDRLFAAAAAAETKVSGDGNGGEVEKGGQGGSLPKIYKCFHWGSVAECMHYLHRRAVENRGSAERTRHMAEALGRELRRRALAWTWPDGGSSGRRVAR